MKSVDIEADRIIIQNLFPRTKKEMPLGLVDGIKTTSKRIRGGRVYEIIIIVN